MKLFVLNSLLRKHLPTPAGGPPIGLAIAREARARENFILRFFFWEFTLKICLYTKFRSWSNDEQLWNSQRIGRHSMVATKKLFRNMKEYRDLMTLWRRLFRTHVENLKKKAAIPWLIGELPKGFIPMFQLASYFYYLGYQEKSHLKTF